jgi:hypothetical protein
MLSLGLGAARSNGKLLTEGEVLKNQFRTAPKGGTYDPDDDGEE